MYRGYIKFRSSGLFLQVTVMYTAGQKIPEWIPRGLAMYEYAYYLDLCNIHLA